MKQYLYYIICITRLKRAFGYKYWKIYQILTKCSMKIVSKQLCISKTKYIFRVMLSLSSRWSLLEGFFCITFSNYRLLRRATLQMLTGIYRVIKGFFCNICRENPVIFTDCREIPADIAGFPCRYCRKNP